LPKILKSPKPKTILPWNFTTGWYDAVDDLGDRKDMRRYAHEYYDSRKTLVCFCKVTKPASAYQATKIVAVIFPLVIFYLTITVHGRLLRYRLPKILKSPKPKTILPWNFTAGWYDVFDDLGGRRNLCPHANETTATLEETSVIETPEPPVTEWPDTMESSVIPEEPIVFQTSVTETSEPEMYREQIILNFDCEYIARMKAHSGHLYLYASHLSLNLPLKEKEKKYPLAVRIYIS
jgi:hypothetical protein